MSIPESEKLAFVRSATSRMVEATFDCICSVLGGRDDDSGEPIGSGFRIRRGGQCWLVTAQHVAVQAASRFGRIAVTLQRGEPPTEIESPPLVDNVADVAAFLLPSAFATVPAWSIGRIEISSDTVDRDFLFMHGFPGSDARFSRTVKRQCCSVIAVWGDETAR